MDNIGTSPTQTLSTSSFFTPLLISIMGIGAAAFTIVIYHLLVVKYCVRRQAERTASLQAFACAGIPTGVDEKTLMTIPIVTYSRTGSVGSDQCECAVCLGDVDDGDRVRLLPNCKHVFHVKCIDEWFVGHTSCPVCRVGVGGPGGPEDEGQVPVCRSPVGASTIDRSVGFTDEPESGPGNQPVQTLRHCNSLVLPRERKDRFSGIVLKRSLSMGQSTCVNIDIQVDNNEDKDCSNCYYYFSIRDQSIRQLQRVSSKVRQSFSRMRVRQGRGIILPY